MAMSRKLSFSAVLKGDALAYVSMLAFRDTKSFVAGVLHRHSGSSFSSRNLLGIPHFFPAYSLKRNFPS